MSSKNAVSDGQKTAKQKKTEKYSTEFKQVVIIIYLGFRTIAGNFLELRNSYYLFKIIFALSKVTF